MLQDLLVKYVQEKRVPGISVGYITLDKNYFVSAGYDGYPEYVEPKKVTYQTLYDMASCSKVVVTTTCILKLIEEGLFDLDSTVQSIIPEFKFSEVTILNLLTHTSGLPADDKNYKSVNSAEEMWQFTLNQPLVYQTGTKVEYSDFGFIILGKIIEKYKGSIEDFAKETIFDPLGMNASCYNPYQKGKTEQCAPAEVTNDRGVIRGIVHDGKANKLDGLSGNAGLFSNIEDLSKFVRMMIMGGKPVLKRETVNKLKQAYTQDLNLSRTIGWFFNDPTTPVYGSSSDCALWHTGFSGTSILIDFKKQCGVIILTNRVHPTRNNDITDIRKEIHEYLLKQ